MKPDEATPAALQMTHPTDTTAALREPWRGIYSRAIKLGAAILAQRHWGSPIALADAEKQDDALAVLGMEARGIADAIRAAALASSSAPAAVVPVDADSRGMFVARLEAINKSELLSPNFVLNLLSDCDMLAQRAAQAPQPAPAPEPAAPEEWKWVPVEPTEKMLQASWEDADPGFIYSDHEEHIARAWAAMLAATPAQPVAAPSAPVQAVAPVVAWAVGLMSEPMTEHALWKTRPTKADIEMLDDCFSGQPYTIMPLVPLGTHQPAAQEAPREAVSDAARRDPHRGGNSYEASMLRNLLAVIHRDGGHYVEEHGLDKALDDAEARVVALMAALDELLALKDLKDRIEARAAYGFNVSVSVNGSEAKDPELLAFEIMKADYTRRKPLAWAAALAASTVGREEQR